MHLSVDEEQDIAIKQDVRECHKCDNDSKKLTVIDVWLSVAKRANPFKKLIGDKFSASVVDVVEIRCQRESHPRLSGRSR